VKHLVVAHLLTSDAWRCDVVYLLWSRVWRHRGTRSGLQSPRISRH